MYLTRGGNVQRPLTSGPGGGGPAKSPGRPARFYVGLACGFVDMCLHEKGKAKAAEKVVGGLSTWLVGHVAWSADRHMVSYRLGQVGGAPPQPYKYPLLVEIRTHTTFWRFHL
jgi:hypothetical protein